MILVIKIVSASSLADFRACRHRVFT